MEDTLEKGGARGRFDPKKVRAAKYLLGGIRKAWDFRFPFHLAKHHGKTSFCLTCPHLYNTGQLCCVPHNGCQHRGPCIDRDQGSLNLGM